MFRSYDKTVDALNIEMPTVFHGSASYYGAENGFHGSCMANGEIYDKEAMTAAHRSLPLGTKVRVRYGTHSVIVFITDRGPYAKDRNGRLIQRRVIDLSEAAARKLGLIKKGVDQVTVEVLEEPEESQKHHHQNPECLKDEETREPQGVAMNAKIERSWRFFLSH